MESEVPVGEGFGFPGLIQRVDSHSVGIHGDKDRFFVAGLVGSYVFGKPAFQTPAFVVVGAGAFLLVVISGFEAVYVEIPDVAADFVETADEFFEVGHFLAFLCMRGMVEGESGDWGEGTPQCCAHFRFAPVRSRAFGPMEKAEQKFSYMRA